LRQKEQLKAATGGKHLGSNLDVYGVQRGSSMRAGNYDENESQLSGSSQL
jgi:hypothetical protein